MQQKNFIAQLYISRLHSNHNLLDLSNEVNIWNPIMSIEIIPEMVWFEI